MKKEKALTFTEALTMYFGGVHGVSRMSFPLHCKCKGASYPDKKGNEIPIMSVEECFIHIRRIHKERIKNPPQPKTKQLSI